MGELADCDKHFTVRFVHLLSIVIFNFIFNYDIAVQLLQKLHITAAGKGEKLLRVIKNPVTQYLPIKSRKIGNLCFTIY